MQKHEYFFEILYLNSAFKKIVQIIQWYFSKLPGDSINFGCVYTTPPILIYTRKGWEKERERPRSLTAIPSTLLQHLTTHKSKGVEEFAFNKDPNYRHPAFAALVNERASPYRLYLEDTALYELTLL